VIVQARVNGVRVVQVSFDIVNKRLLGHIEKSLDFSPTLATIFGDLDQTVVGADIQQTFHQR